MPINLPPSGVGLYGRAQTVDFYRRFRFVVLPALRSDTPAKARELKSAGVRVWIYAGPNEWLPGRWSATLANQVSLVESLGIEGLVADCETGWSDNTLSADDKRSIGIALGDALKNAAARVRIGITSVPWFGVLQYVADRARGSIWGTPQMYHPPIDRFMGNWQQWQAAFGVDHVIPSFAAWPSNSFIHDAATYDAYLATVPRAVGAIGWPTGSGPDYIFDRLRTWSPSGPLPLRLALEARGLLSTWPVRIALILIAVVVIAAIALGTRRFVL